MASSNSSSISIYEEGVNGGQGVSGEWAGCETRSLPSSPVTGAPPKIQRSGSATEFSSWLSYLVPGNRCRVTRNGVKLPVVVKSAALMQPWSMGTKSGGGRKHSCHHHEQAVLEKRTLPIERRLA